MEKQLPPARYLKPYALHSFLNRELVSLKDMCDLGGDIGKAHFITFTYVINSLLKLLGYKLLRRIDNAYIHLFRGRRQS